MRSSPGWKNKKQKNSSPSLHRFARLFPPGTASQSKRRPSWFSRPSPATLWPPCRPPSKPSTLCCLTARASASTCRRWPNWRRAKSFSCPPPFAPRSFLSYSFYFIFFLCKERRATSVKDSGNLKKRRLSLKAGNLFLHYVGTFSPHWFLFFHFTFYLLASRCTSALFYPAAF